MTDPTMSQCLERLLTFHILLTPCKTVPLHKLTIFQLVKNLPVSSNTPPPPTRIYYLIHASTTGLLPEPDKSSPHPTILRSSLIFSFRLFLGLPIILLPSGYPNKTLHTFLFPPSVLALSFLNLIITMTYQ